MKLSITIAENAGPRAPFILRGNYAQAIRTASEMGYTAVELHINDPETCDVQSIIESCNRYNITVSSLGTGLGYAMDGLSLSSPHAETREKAIQRISSHIRLASQLNCLVIIGLIRGQVRESSDKQAFLCSFQESLEACLKLAEKENVVLAVEAINRFESDCLNTLEETAEFIRQFNHPLLKLHIDTFHMNIEESDFIEPIFKVKDVLGHVHIVDNNRMYPGMGMIDFKQILRALSEINYQGFLAVECLPLPTSQEAARGTLRNINTLLD